MKKEQLQKVIFNQLRAYLTQDNYRLSIKKLCDDWDNNMFIFDIDYIYQKITKWIKIGSIKTLNIIVKKDIENDELIAVIYLCDNGYNTLKLNVGLFPIYNFDI